MKTKRMQAYAGSVVRATYYYSRACPLSFWDSLQRETVYNDLKCIQQDGFDSIVLLLPVALVELRHANSEFYAIFKKDLQYIIDTCRECGLRYLFRIFYTWDSYPGKIDKTSLLRNIFNPRLRCNYTSFLDDIWPLVRHDKNFVFGFTSWEDLTPQLISVTPKCSLAVRRKVAAEINLPTKLQEEGGVPSALSKMFPDYLNYIDQRFAALHAELSSHFPLLTSEIRIDVTPIAPECSNKSFHVHHEQHSVAKGTGVLATYYAPYMGAPNSGDEISGASAVRNFIRSQAIFDSNPDIKPFISQLIFVIGQESFASYSKIAVDQLENAVCNGVGNWLRDRSVGYATWSFQDYILSAISNASFHLPQLAGWEIFGPVQQLGPGSIRIQKGGIIQQPQLTRNVSRCLLRLEFESINNAVIVITLNSSGLCIKLDYGSKQCVSHVFSHELRDIQADCLKIEVVSGACVLKSALLGWDHHSNGGYALNGDPGVMTSIWKKLNKTLANESQSTSRFHSHAKSNPAKTSA